MMMNKRLIAMVGESKKYIAGNVIFQWLGMLANILMMYSITGFLGTLLPDSGREATFTRTSKDWSWLLYSVSWHVSFAQSFLTA